MHLLQKILVILTPFFCFAQIETERLILRPWYESDLNIIHAVMQDSEVNFYLRLHHLDKHTTLDQMAQVANKNIEEKGYGYFICELKSTKEVIGIFGLNDIALNAPYFPCATISGILNRSYWKYGYATEAGKALIQYGFSHCNMTEIFACSVKNNISSTKAMERLGMQFVCTFNYPGIEEDNPLCQHVLYKINKGDPLVQ